MKLWSRIYNPSCSKAGSFIPMLNGVLGLFWISCIHKVQFDDFKEEESDSQQINKLTCFYSMKTKDEALLKYLLLVCIKTMLAFQVDVAMCSELLDHWVEGDGAVFKVGGSVSWSNLNFYGFHHWLLLMPEILCNVWLTASLYLFKWDCMLPTQ